MILEQYNAEGAKTTENGIDPKNVEQNLTTATEPTVILRYQSRIETKMTQIETGLFRNPLCVLK